MNNKSLYQSFFSKNKLPIYFAPQWLNAVCGKNSWDVILEINGDNIIQGALVFKKSKSLGLSFVTMPQLTPYSGIWINYPKGLQVHSKISFEKKITEALIQKLPSFSFYYQQFHPRVKNWLPFMWSKFSQRTSYTYRIEDLSNLDNIYRDFKGSVRTDIKKAADSLVVKEIENYSEFKQFLVVCFKKQNKENPYALETFDEIDKFLKSTNQRKIFGAYNSKNELVASNYIIYDQRCAYYFASAYDVSHGSKAPVSLLIWKAIQALSNQVSVFDFEGSIIPGIEHFIRGFGGKLTPIFKIFKSSNPVLHFLISMKYKEFR